MFKSEKRFMTEAYIVGVIIGMIIKVFPYNVYFFILSMMIIFDFYAVIMTMYNIRKKAERDDNE